MLLTLREHSALTCPVGNLADKVEEEISLGNGDDFVGDLDEEAEALARPQVEALRDALAEVLRPRRGVDLKGLQRNIKLA